MGIGHSKEVWTSIPKLGGKDGQDPDSPTDGGGQSSQDVSNRDEEASHRRLGRNLRSVDSRYSFRGNQLRVYPYTEEEL